MMPHLPDWSATNRHGLGQMARASNEKGYHGDESITATGYVSEQSQIVVMQRHALLRLDGTVRHLQTDGVNC
jgi:hypothetical protein